MTERRAGLLLPLFSVPGNQGIGDFGQKTIRMIDEIAKAGYKIWQILPLQMTGISHSPYQNLSSFAGDPIYINIDRLSEMGLLTQSSIINCNKFKDYIYYDEVRSFKENYFRRAFRTFKKNFEKFEAEFNAFKEEAFWLKDWTLYSLFKSLYNFESWDAWEEEYRDYPLDDSNIDLSEYADELFYFEFLQFLFDKQLKEVVDYAKRQGLQIMGDVPFYVDYDSADVWACREDFYLNDKGKPEYVAGCPPDASNENGQIWGMPIYNFKELKKDGYSFWKKRIEWMRRYYEILRIDHFQAIDVFWRISGHAKSAKDGKWVLGPRRSLLEVMKAVDPRLEFVAEDFGPARPEVKDLEKEFDIPGMENLVSHLEAKWLKKPIESTIFLYSSTHDEPTVEEAYASFENNKRISLRRFFKKRGYNYRGFHDMVCAFALDSDAETVILALQDVCGYKGQTRINTPGTINNQNWTWKLKDFKTFPNELMKSRAWIEKAGRL